MSAAARSRWGAYVRLLIVSVSLFVAGCAGTRVGPVTSQAPNTSPGPPRTIAVAVENDSPVPEKETRREKHLADAQAALAGLSDGLSKLLASRQLAVVPAGQSADLTLLCRILDVRSGSKALRVLIGYGAGKAVLRVGVSLTESGAHDGAPLLSFETKGTTGNMPGGGFSAPALVGDGLNALRKDGLPKEIDETTENIDEQLGKYFSARNWPYPKPDETGEKVGTERPR